ncbi:MAG: DUF5666 domain-containing protein [Nitrospiraceae bacterium]
MWVHLILTFVCLFISTASVAHGTDQHVLGTVMAIHGTHVEVKTPMGGTVDVRVDKQTRFKEKNNPKGGQVPMVGDRVIITATKSDKLLLATEVYFSSARRALAPIQPISVR